MSALGASEVPPPADRAVAVQIGSVRVSGVNARILIVLLLSVIAGLVVWSRAAFGMVLTGMVWGGFLLYWSAAARNGPTQAQRESTASRQLHTRLLYTALLLLFLPVPGLRVRLFPPSVAWIVGGLLFQTLFFLLAVWARRNLGGNWSGAIAVAQNHELIRSGPYRWVRHPIYTAMLGMCIATAIVSGEVHAAMGFIVMVGAYMRKIPQEERTLRSVFGPAYDAYCRQTRAVVPFVI